MLPNTFEDALVYDNVEIFRGLEGAGAIAKFKDALNAHETAAELAKAMFEILQTAKKAEFALDLLDVKQEPWPIACPRYIREGLSWLEEKLRQKQQEIVPDTNASPTTETVQT